MNGVILVINNTVLCFHGAEFSFYFLKKRKDEWGRRWGNNVQVESSRG